MSQIGLTRVIASRRMTISEEEKNCAILSPFSIRLRWYPRQESNLHYLVRNEEFYPLNYEGVVLLLIRTTRAIVFGASLTLYPTVYSNVLRTRSMAVA